MQRERRERSEMRFFRLVASVCLTVYLLAILAPLSNAAGKKQLNDYRDAKSGVVRIVKIDSENGISTGSGFGIGKVNEETDIYITNRHVIWDEKADKPADEIFIPLREESYFRDGNSWSLKEDEIVKCHVLYPLDRSDPEYPDFAIIQAEAKIEDRIALPLLSAKKVVDGDDVWAIGYPGSADRDFDPNARSGSVDASTITRGNITRRVRLSGKDDTYILIHTAQTNKGNSGGPLLTERGAVIGINTYVNYYSGVDSGLKDDQGNKVTIQNNVVEYNLAVYIDYTMNKLDELGIEYDTYKPLNLTLIIAISAGAVAVAVILIVLVKNAKKKHQPVPKEFRLQGISGIYAGRRFPINGIVKLGRLKDNNDLIFPDGIGVSGMHCQLKEENDTVYLIDLNSRNGTWVNGEKLQPGQPREMKEGDSFHIGKNREGKITEGFRIDVNQIKVTK